MGQTNKKVFDRVYCEPTGNITDLIPINAAIDKLSDKINDGDYISEKQRLHYLNLICEHEKDRKKYMQALGLLPVRRKSN